MTIHHPPPPATLACPLVVVRHAWPATWGPFGERDSPQGLLESRPYLPLLGDPTFRSPRRQAARLNVLPDVMSWEQVPRTGGLGEG